MKFDFTLEYVDVSISGRPLKFYPLNFKALRTLAGELETLKNSSDPSARFVSVCKVLAASANRQGTTTNETELEELLSVDWANQIITAVNVLSGFTKTEGASDPKVVPLHPTGVGSTAVLSPLLDGPGQKLTN